MMMVFPVSAIWIRVCRTSAMPSGIQTIGGFVKNEYLRIADHGGSNGEPLLHSQGISIEFDFLR